MRKPRTTRATNAAKTPSAAILDEPRLTPKEAAKRLKVCTKTLLTRIANNEISPVFRHAKSGPGSIEIPLSSIKSYELQRLKGGVK